ncbi:helix-turn-helix domain-containing protein [Parafrankia sp. FMc2]|uniref:helix-turn-helix domain-containing protein n=1 Tax=Parafrankia sp. FMc2 TaxID=3233196 RepID=UPI0034D6EA7C
MEETTKPRSLGEHIRQARIAKGLSGAQLGRLAGTNSSNITRIESGETASPTLELLRRIAGALDLDLAEVLAYCGVAVSPAAPTLRVYLRRTYPGLPDEAVREAERAVARIVEKYGAGH